MSRPVPTLLLAALLVGLLPTAASAEIGFADVTGSAHEEAIETMAQTRVVAGYDDGTFRPGEAVRRDHAASLFARALLLEDAEHDFDDVSSSNAHSGAIGAITTTEPPVTTGYEDGTFRPSLRVTRAQMATFVTRAFHLPEPSGGPMPFSDVDPSGTHADGIRAAAEAGVTTGYPDGTFRPTATVTRGQMARFLVRALQLEGPVPCAPLDGPPELETIGAAVPPDGGYLTTGAVRVGDALELFSNDQATSRSARVAGSAIRSTGTIPHGTRTWAHAPVDDGVYVGQWGAPAGEDNVFHLPADGDGDRRAEAIARVPTGGEFWALTTDDDGILWAGTRAHADPAFREEIGMDADVEEGEIDDTHVIHRIDPGPFRKERRVSHVTFEIPGGPPSRDGRRPDIKQLVWHDDTLFVGLGQQAGGARLYALRDLDAAGGPEVTDITPANLEPARGVFSLDVTDELVAMGTQTSQDEGGRVIVLDRTDLGHVLADVALRHGEDTEDRVDAVHVDGDRVLAAPLPSGAVYEVDVSDRGLEDPTTAPLRRVGVPVENTTTRLLEVVDDGIQGVTGTGRVWTMREDGTQVREPVDVALLPGVPLAPGRAHSLTATDEHLVAGASNLVTLRPLADPDEVVTVGVGGEAKALAGGDGRLFAAVYPNGELWEIFPDEERADLVVDWDNNYNRPMDATWVDGRVLVVARHADDHDRSALIAIDTGDPEFPYTVTPVEDHRGGDARGQSVASDGRLAFVGTSTGTVRAIGLDEDLTWSRRPGRGDVRSLEMVGDRVVGLAGGDAATWFEVGAASRRIERWGRPDRDVEAGVSGDGAVLGPVSIAVKPRGVVAIERGADAATSLVRHRAQETFGGPYGAVGTDCGIHVISGRELVRLPYDAHSRLER